LLEIEQGNKTGAERSKMNTITEYAMTNRASASNRIKIVGYEYAYSWDD
jgi:hypothetical protein